MRIRKILEHLLFQHHSLQSDTSKPWSNTFIPNSRVRYKFFIPGSKSTSLPDVTQPKSNVKRWKKTSRMTPKSRRVDFQAQIEQIYYREDRKFSVNTKSQRSHKTNRSKNTRKLRFFIQFHYFINFHARHENRRGKIKTYPRRTTRVS